MRAATTTTVIVKVIATISTTATTPPMMALVLSELACGSDGVVTTLSLSPAGPAGSENILISTNILFKLVHCIRGVFLVGGGVQGAITA